MVRINLLPHREQKRHARQRQFISMAIGLAVLGVAVVGLVSVRELMTTCSDPAIFRICFPMNSSAT